MTSTTHYGPGDVTARVQAALDRLPPGTPLDAALLGPLDQFHVGGAAATARLAAALAPPRGARVLEVGSGLGGPARFLAATYGCEVTGIDLTESFVAIARLLAARTGQAAQVHFEVGDALALPFADGAFELAWTQHVAMNIADRPRLYAGIHRVLVPGGRLAMFDVISGNGEPLRYPLPWATTADHSCVLDEPTTRAVLEAAGFAIESWLDVTAAGIQQLTAQRAAMAAGPSALGLHLVMGPEFGRLAANLEAELVSGRARLLQAIVQRAA